jgi:hypothetical protein
LLHSLLLQPFGVQGYFHLRQLLSEQVVLAAAASMLVAGAGFEHAADDIC